MAETLTGRDASGLFQELSAAEEHHMEMLSALYRGITGTAGDIDFPSLMGRYPQEKIMEGGMRLDDALAWSEEKAPSEILELSVSLEAGSYDRYLAMLEKVSDENSLKVFSTLADEEKRHLGKLTVMFEKLV
jgi:rubrerythrin